MHCTSFHLCALQIRKLCLWEDHDVAPIPVPREIFLRIWTNRQPCCSLGVSRVEESFLTSTWPRREPPRWHKWPSFGFGVQRFGLYASSSNGKFCGELDKNDPFHGWILSKHVSKIRKNCFTSFESGMKILENYFRHKNSSLKSCHFTSKELWQTTQRPRYELFLASEWTPPWRQRPTIHKKSKREGYILDFDLLLG